MNRRPSRARRGPESDIDVAQRVIGIEASALTVLAARLGDEFPKAVELVVRCRGKVVVAGLGKSGLICRKLAATLASTGTPALFLHAAEGLHGDIGLLARGDVLVALSNSGTTGELLALLAPARRLDLPVIAITGDLTSPLAREADVALDAGVAEEACPMGLTPTASTTAAMALGDALAIAVLERRGFRAEDFGQLHPGGALGRRLRPIEELMRVGEAVPCVFSEATMAEAIAQMSGKQLGVTAVVDDRGALVGVVTDGDLRRAMQARGDIRDLPVTALMTAAPKTIAAHAPAEQALARMEEFSITVLFVVETDDRLRGVIHLHDLLRAGVV